MLRVVDVVVEGARPLWFDDGTPVRAASAVVRLGDGWLVVQDDATHAAWVRTAETTRVRLVPPIGGLDVFSEAAGTKLAKPDFEAACPLTVDGLPAALVFGSGSHPARHRAALVVLDGAEVRSTSADVGPVHEAVAVALGIDPGDLNLEAACVRGGDVLLFQRGNRQLGVPDAVVPVALAPLVDAVRRGDPPDVPVGSAATLDLGALAGAAVAVTDAIPLPDARVLLSVAAEDTPNAIDDGPVVAAGLVVVDGAVAVDRAPFPMVAGAVPKVEGLALDRVLADGVRVVGVVDADDPALASLALTLRIRW
jgi:hypothetical protein